MPVVMPNGTDEQPDPDGDYQYGASELERWCAADATQSGANHRKASQHQNSRRSDMGQDQHSACCDSGNEPCRVSEIIRDKCYLTMPWHERVHEAEKPRDSQGGKNG